jgi:glycerophosphoryl diester phosphodiesterase
MTPILLVHHAANRDHSYPASSPPALRSCLEAGARVLETDIALLADGEFALLHGPTLESETTGRGPIGAVTSDEVRALRYVDRGQGLPTEVPVGLLPEALDLLRHYPGTMELQLDLKPDVYSSDEVLERLIAAVQPVKERVRVTSPSDWALRRLRRIDPELPLGFDPLLYIEIDYGADSDPSVPPFRRGAYGYWDDHPLAMVRWGRPAAYLAARAEALWAQAPAEAVWYIDAALLGQALDDGFDWIAYLHGLGAEVDAWTLDAHKPERLALAQRLAAAGIDRITTNNAPALSRALGAETVY